MKKVYLIIFSMVLLCMLLLVAACDNTEDNCDGDCTDDDQTEDFPSFADELFNDKRIYVPSEHQVLDAYTEAGRFCKSLKVDGVCGWRLPTLKELRSLIVDCDTTELGGSCETGLGEDNANDTNIDYENCGRCRAETNTDCLFDSRLGLTECPMPYWTSAYNMPSGPGSNVMLDFKTGALSYGWAAPREGFCHFEYGYGDFGDVICILDETDRKCYEPEAYEFNDREFTVNNGVVESSDGLVWQKESSGNLSQSEASQYCDDLSLDEFDDWRLPTIEELRSLTKNCWHLALADEYYSEHPPSVSASCCTIVDSVCLSTECNVGMSQSGSWCGCYHTETDSGCYWTDDTWLGGCETAFWSSSEVTDKAGSHWVLNIGDTSTREEQGWEGSQIIDKTDSDKFAVRCVRGTVNDEE